VEDAIFWPRLRVRGETRTRRVKDQASQSIPVRPQRWPSTPQEMTEPSSLDEFTLMLTCHISESGYASLNYGLSQYPPYLQDPRTTNKYYLRTARDPDHGHEILHLQKIYGFGERHVLIGHSCGAMIALQTLIGPPELESLGLVVSGAWRMPAAVLAVDRSYDIPELVRIFVHIAEYRDVVVAAFGDDERVWAEVWPARGNWLQEGKWSKGRKE
jgi:hypothetical protein